MSMHMIRGVREPKSKTKAKKKPGWKQRELEYNQWLQSIGADVGTTKRKKEFEPYVPPKTYVRETTKPRSVGSRDSGVAAVRDVPTYSGSYIVGIATMHKSNLVAVGADDSPVNYSTMRRS